MKIMGKSNEKKRESHIKQILYLEITRKGPHLEVSLCKGEQTLTHYEESNISSKELSNRCNELMHLLNMVSRRGAIPPSVVEEMHQMGQVLYNEIFPLSIKSQLTDYPSSDLILKIDNTLVHVPWELLFDGDFFLCEKFNIGRMVKTQQVVTKRGHFKPSSPLRILVIADPRSDLKASYEEGKRIRDRVHNDYIKVTLFTSEVSKDFLKKRLFNYDLIHYAGHADYDLENPSNSGWLLEDGKFTTLEIRKMGGSNALPWMVFSNACQSGQTEEWQVDETGEEKIYGLANAFLLSGVQHYIGTFWKVLDEPSTNFALKFYDHLLQGQTIGESMRFARLALRETYGNSNILWASYLLYGDPTVKYFVPKSKYEEGELIASGAISTSQQLHHIKKNGLRTRSVSDNNGLYGWKYDDSRKGIARLLRGIKKWPFVIACGMFIGIVILFGSIFYKTFIGLESFTEKIENQGMDLSKGDSEYLQDLVKTGMASDDQLAEYFQSLIKKYNQEHTFVVKERDPWTSRPLTLFLISKNLNGKDVKIEAQVELFKNKLISSLGEDRRITILEREYLETILKELDIGSSPIADPEHSLSLGQIVAGNLFSIISISYIDTKWQANLRIIASETSIIKATLNETWSSSEELDNVRLRLAEKILREIEKAFPLKGLIKMYFSKEKVMLNIGRRHGVENGQKLRVLKEKDILGEDGSPIVKEPVQIASLKVTEVKDEFCYAEVIEQTEELASGMKVSI